MSRRKSFFLSALLLIAILNGCATGSDARKGDEGQNPLSNYIKAIDIADYSLKITAKEKFAYTLTRTSDPFKILVELKDVDQGTFKDRITSAKDGISEISISSRIVPEKAAVLEITLNSPYEVTHEIADNTLSVTLHNGTISGNSAEKKESGQPALSKEQDQASFDKVFESEVVPAVHNEIKDVSDAPPARNVTGISFKREINAVNVVIHGDGAMEPKVSSVNGSIVIDIPGVKLSATIPKEIALPLKALRWEDTAAGVRIVMELKKDTPYEVVAILDTVIVSLAAPSSASSSASPGAIRERALPKDEVVSRSTGAGKKQDLPSGMKTFPTPQEGVAGSGSIESGSTGTAASGSGPQASSLEKTNISICSGASIRCNTGNLLTLDFQKADIVAVFRVLAQESGCNIVVDPSVAGQVTMQVKDARWYEIVDLIKRIHGLGCEVTGNNIIRIAQNKTLEDQKKTAQDELKRETEEANQRAKYEKAILESQKKVKKTFKLNYIKADDVVTVLLGHEPKGLKKTIEGTAATTGQLPFSPQGAEAGASAAQQSSEVTVSTGSRRLTDVGSVSSDPNLNQVFVEDVESNMKSIEEIITSMDVPQKQVMIEARIVEINKNLNDQLGINWGLLTNALDKTSSAGISGNSSGVLTGNSLLGNMPATVGGMAGGGVALGLINAQRTLGLDVRLQALESSGNGKIITNPRILTMNNQKATVSQGVQVPYPVMNQQGIVSAAFLSIAVTINITPQINPDDSIILDLDLTKSDLTGFTTIGGSQTPNTDTLSEKTKVLVNDGETLVLGGVFRSNNSVSDTGTPMLKDIPLLGWLFKSGSKAYTEYEFFIFITPKVIAREISRGAPAKTVSE